MMFAETDAKALATFLNVTQYIAMWVIAIAGAIAVFRKPPKQQREVTMGFEAASKKEFEEHVKANEAKFGAIEQEFKQVRAAASERRRVMFLHVDEVKHEMQNEIKEVAKQMVHEVKELSVQIAEVGVKTDALKDALKSTTESLTAQIVQLDQRFERTREV
jgi:hypothetical protein